MGTIACAQHMRAHICAQAHLGIAQFTRAQLYILFAQQFNNYWTIRADAQQFCSGPNICDYAKSSCTKQTEFKNCTEWDSRHKDTFHAMLSRDRSRAHRLLTWTQQLSPHNVVHSCEWLSTHSSCTYKLRACRRLAHECHHAWPSQLIQRSRESKLWEKCQLAQNPGAGAELYEQTNTKSCTNKHMCRFETNMSTCLYDCITHTYIQNMSAKTYFSELYETNRFTELNEHMN
jgi:hypothetical protein